ncbi:MAG: hypothetical protein H7330_13640 [Hymenobacteraceae bacterium]|nr:hypothetical protein [Hymenobacteraceae bacterium]
MKFVVIILVAFVFSFDANGQRDKIIVYGVRYNTNTRIPIHENDINDEDVYDFKAETKKHNFLKRLNKRLLSQKIVTIPDIFTAVRMLIEVDSKIGKDTIVFSKGRLFCNKRECFEIDKKTFGIILKIIPIKYKLSVTPILFDKR